MPAKLNKRQKVLKRLLTRRNWRSTKAPPSKSEVNFIVGLKRGDLVKIQPHLYFKSCYNPITLNLEYKWEPEASVCFANEDGTFFETPLPRLAIFYNFDNRNVSCPELARCLVGEKVLFIPLARIVKPLREDLKKLQIDMRNVDGQYPV